MEAQTAKETVPFEWVGQGVERGLSCPLGVRTGTGKARVDSSQTCGAGPC